MKILIATGLYPPDIGGPATYSVFLEKHLPKAGHSFVTVPYRVVRKYPKVIRHFMYILELLRARKGCDIIYALDTISVGLPAMIVSILTRIPLYLRVPGDYAWEQGQQRFGVTDILDVYLTHKSHSIFVRILAWLQYCVATHATQIVVPSEYMKRVVASWGIHPGKITRVYTELKEIFVTETREALRTEFGYEEFVVSTAGRLVPWKGMAKLIDGIHLLQSRKIPVRLEIIGDGSCRAELEKQVQELGASQYIHFLGAVSHQEVGRRVKAADVFALNTSYEGLSHHLVEAMSLGVPIVTTPVGGNVELITTEVEGILVPFNDIEKMTEALMRIHDDRALREKLVLGARKKVALFHEDVVVQDFFKLLD